nr:hypothetical protein [Tanacetum cinerariifolium]
VESIFATASSSVAPLPTPIPTMTPSIITTITTASHPPIPPTPIPSEVLQNLPTFDSVFRFNERLKSLEATFSEYRQTNPFAKAVSNILGIVHQYMNQQLNEMEGNKSIQRSDEQRHLYKALVDAYEADKTILDSYGKTAILKRRREDDDDQEGPSTGSDRGLRDKEKASTSESAIAEEPVQTTSQIEETSHPVFETGAEDQPIVQTSQHPEWFPQPKKPPTPDRDWNKTLPAVQGSAQTWISELAKQADSRFSFNELLDTLLDFSNFIMNRLGVDTLTPELLAGPTYELMRGSCNSLTELEYHLEEVYKATTDQLDWVNPEEVARTEATQLKIVLRRSKQESHISQIGGSSTDGGTSSKPGVLDVPFDDSEEEISWNSSDDEDEEIAKIDEPEDIESSGGDDEETESDGESEEEETREEEEESFDPIPRTPEDSEDDGYGKEDQGLKVSEEQRLIEEEEAEELYRDQESSSVSSQFVSNILNPTSDAGMESIFATASSPMAPLQTTTPIMTPYTIATITIISHASIPPTTIPSEGLQNLPTFDSVFRFEDRLKSLEANFSEFIQTNQFAKAVSNIPGIVHQYMNQQMMKAVREAVQIQTDRLCDSYQRENDEFLRTIDDNMKRIIKEHVKSQVKEQVSRILPRIEESVNAQLEAEVLTRSSHSSRTTYAVAADLSKMELKKILIEKMEGNKETAILKRRREDDDDDQEGPSAGSYRGSKRRRESGEPESARAPLEPATRSPGRSTTGSKSWQASVSESAFTEEPVKTTSQIEEPSHLMFETGAEDQPIVQTSQHPEWFPQLKKPPTSDRDWNKTLPAAQGSTQLWISDLETQADSRTSFSKLLDTPLDFSNFIMNRLSVDTLTPKLLAGPTYELMRGSCNSLTELEYHLEEVYKATTDQLDWVNLECQRYPHNLL